MSEQQHVEQEIFDSLPYYDNDLDVHPALKQKVEAELVRESRNNPQTLHPKVPPPIELFSNNPLLKAELERVESHQPIPPLDTIRYQLPAPTNIPATDEDWQAALKNAKAQLEHQRIRQNNIALLQTYGTNAWKIQNYLMEHIAKELEKALEDLRNRTTDVNRERKQFQTKLGAQLTSLETRWTELISTVLQIELANVALEAEVNDLARRESELSAM
ncbi:breast carcinoma amplified sequence 2 [Fomitiporia mediterranea MF3/22]|uniref:breast carcinoma amplified sequence 2 n=1 Tax=Fomitiporia mediterranea (strain MF3/22) TaxID=694068 RepID=UPI000440873D|nr:breast carcinoma amplified sequence 2 [Fomitiporia mediterranea MF3/22]EJD04309.1 breast carcinoma amplified sequence 2 [Fomitiporia mediterranea MF3/22]